MLNQAQESAVTVGIYTLGCKVNQYESEAIAEALEQNGFTVLPFSKPCSIYIINTCTVTAESDRKARQFIRRAISRNPEAGIIVTGCYAQASPEAVGAIEGVDVIVGNREKMQVVRAAMELVRTKEKRLAPEILVPSLADAGFEPMTITRFDRTRAYVKIEDGCESHCTYCIIPSARGAIRSKAFSDVLEEVKVLTENGCPEIVLTGIETASYGKDLGDTSLADLLIAVDRIPGIGRIRLGSLDPSLIKPAFVEKIASLQSLAPHFHLSMQSGSSAVLRRMKRKYNREQALSAMQLLRDAIPSVQFTTDIIVGFPGEREEDFMETVSLIESGRFLMTHIFPYSKRKGTLAADMPDQVPEDEKHRRLLYLSEIAERAERAILEDAIAKGEAIPVLFETFKDGVAHGHTANFFEVSVETPCPLDGKTFPVLLLRTDGHICYGKIV